MWEFPGGQVVKIPAFTAMVQVQSLVRELRSWKTQGGQKKEKRKKDTCFHWGNWDPTSPRVPQKRKISLYIENNHQRHNKQRQNKTLIFLLSVQSVSLLCPTLCNSTDCSKPGFPVHHQLLELAQTDIHRVGDAIQPSYPLQSPSPPAFNLSQHQGLFQWVTSSHQVAKVLELQLQHQSFQWIFRINFLEDRLDGSLCSPRDSQESSPTPQFKSINSLNLSFLYSPTLTSIHDYWKNHSFD